MYISQVNIKNIRCFEDIELSFNIENNKQPCLTTIVGDNATGKSCFLRCLAIGLCDESSAAGLLKEFEEAFIRRGAESGSIVIDIVDPNTPGKNYQIETIIEKIKIIDSEDKPDTIERIRQKTIPDSEPFPWGKIFACAYGAGRGTSGTGDIAGYSVINAVYNMFNYSEGLQNPELAIRRIKEHISEEEIFKILKDLMPNINNINLSDSGITVDGLWGDKMPLRDLADGYKSSFLWITDFLGWALSYNTTISNGQDISGIVLVDEVEQHLHPKWQRNIIQSLSHHFPNIQFIFTTHSPLVAANTNRVIDGNIKSQLFHFYYDGISIKRSRIEERLDELNFDQVLSSEAFDYIFEVSPKVEFILKESSRLAAKDNRSPEEEKLYKKIKAEFKKLMFPKSRTLIERVVEKEYYSELEKKAEQFEKLLQDIND